MFENEINLLAKQAFEQYEKCIYKEALKVSFFDMESVGNKEEVWMNELKRLWEHLFNLVARGKHELDPAGISPFPDVVFEGTLPDLPLSEVTAVYHSV